MVPKILVNFVRYNRDRYNRDLYNQVRLYCGSPLVLRWTLRTHDPSHGLRMWVWIPVSPKKLDEKYGPIDCRKSQKIIKTGASHTKKCLKKVWLYFEVCLFEVPLPKKRFFNDERNATTDETKQTRFEL